MRGGICTPLKTEPPGLGFSLGVAKCNGRRLRGDRMKVYVYVKGATSSMMTHDFIPVDWD